MAKATEPRPQHPYNHRPDNHRPDGWHDGGPNFLVERSDRGAMAAVKASRPVPALIPSAARTVPLTLDQNGEHIAY